jgi:hypothetical protein
MAGLRENQKSITPQKVRSVVRQRASRLNKAVERMLVDTSPRLKKRVKKRYVNYCVPKVDTVDTVDANSLQNNDHLLKILKIQKYKLQRNYDKMEIEIANLKESGKLMSIAKQLRVRPKVLYSLTDLPKMKLSDRKVKQEDIDSVRKALDDNNVSCELPHKRHQGKKFLRVTIVQAYRHYLKQQENAGDRKLSLSSFNRYKPWYIRLLRCMPDLGCQCDVCLNCGLKSDALIANKVKGLSKRLTTNLFKTLCNNPNKNIEDMNMKDFELNCILRKCSFCSVGRLEKELLDNEQNKELNWKHTVFHSKWENVAVPQRNPGDKKRTTFERKKIASTLEELLRAYLVDLKTMALHQFNFRFQGEQFEEWKEKLVPGDILMVSDFSTNYSHKFLVEPQSKHWCRKQTTVHNTVCYFRCPHGCGAIVTHEIVCLSDDRKHDCFAVDAFENRMLKHFRESAIPVKRIIRFSDNCATQYKSFKVFDIMSRKTIPYLLNHFGAKHGKGPADGVGGRTMQHIDRAINNGVVDIIDAESMAKYLTETVGLLTEAQAISKRMSRPKFHRATPKEKAQIRTFFFRDDISMNFKGKRVVKVTLKEAHTKYIEFVNSQNNGEESSKAISMTSFLRHKPANVLTGVKCDPEETQVSTDDGILEHAKQSMSDEASHESQECSDGKLNHDAQSVAKESSHETRVCSPEEQLPDSLSIPDEENTIHFQRTNAMCEHFQRCFFHVNTIDRTLDTSKARTVTMTRQIHSYRNTGVPGFMEVRRHSCSCDACFLGRDMECKNIKHVGNFSRANCHGTEQRCINHKFENTMWKGRLSLDKAWKTTAAKRPTDCVCDAKNTRSCVCPRRKKNQATRQPIRKDPGFKTFRKKRTTTRGEKQNMETSASVATSATTVRRIEANVSSDDEIAFDNIDIGSTHRSPRKSTIDQRNDTFTSRDNLPLIQLTLPDSDSDICHLGGVNGASKDQSTSAVICSSMSDCQEDIPLSRLLSNSPAFQNEQLECAEISQTNHPSAKLYSAPQGENQLKVSHKLPASAKQPKKHVHRVETILPSSAKLPSVQKGKFKNCLKSTKSQKLKQNSGKSSQAHVRLSAKLQSSKKLPSAWKGEKKLKMSSNAVGFDQAR